MFGIYETVAGEYVVGEAVPDSPVIFYGSKADCDRFCEQLKDEYGRHYSVLDKIYEAMDLAEKL